ncbi:MAG TPA: PCP reductase family protein [Longimicrobiales bacterium]|nr:PCP reductase family protein [Longimicrobiales bacterium]
MKFLCVECDEVMAFAERQIPGDGTMAAVFVCSACGREMAMLTNPMETQLVSSMGVKVGGRTVPEQPMEIVRTGLEEARPDAFVEAGAAGVDESPAAGPATQGPSASAAVLPGRVTWSDEARERLERVPTFVRGMVKRIYTEWARDNGISEMTVPLMDRARSELGLEGM